jgi:hypothetical protein
MTKVYKFLYTIIQITRIMKTQVCRLASQLHQIFRVIVLNESKKECDSGESKEVVRNSHGFPSNLK